MSSSEENLFNGSESSYNSQFPDDITERQLTTVEKTFLLHAERGDVAGVRRIIEEYADRKSEFDLNCVDPLSRSALVAAIENENIELIRLLLDAGIAVKDGLLHAIKEEFVEAVEVLLEWEEMQHKQGHSYSWEKVDKSSSTFTVDINPLILAAHKNNFEIIKILLDRGATLPMPHDVRCGCDDCVRSKKADSLRHSQARINAYKALTSSSLIALSSSDPILTAFQLAWDLRRLSHMETEFRAEYNLMRNSVEDFAMSLLDHTRTSYELMIILNYDHKNPTWESGERQGLERLKLAINNKQKKFVAHPNVQQLLAEIWYEGLPGFRRKSLIGQSVQVVKFAMMFPVYCSIYMMAPYSKQGLFMKKPFVKFICHSAAYGLFLSRTRDNLLLLGFASQRLEIVLFQWFGFDWMLELVVEWKKKERGASLGFAEYGVTLYVFSLVWGEIRALWCQGLMEYVSDLWNIVDFITNMFYVTWFALRLSSWYITWIDEANGMDPWYPREKWHAFEPMLISEGAFAAGMIFSFLKLVHIFSVNPYLGPLQISLGRMIIDIVKFFFIYALVLFAFGCGLNQLLWYYAELEKNKCYHLPNGLPDFENNDKACTIWRRYTNLFETSQSLFWASFGLVDLMSFELTGIKGFTRFWALLMFGSYSVINIIVLLNMLIAMMSNSYQIISERSDVEWKFARSRLWISYFEDSDTLPPPFNIFPTMKMFYKMFSFGEYRKENASFKDRSMQKAKERHDIVTKMLIKRYVTSEQRKRDDYNITEDDVMEIRQDISSLRYELIDILQQNGMKVPNIENKQISGKKDKVLTRRIMKDFHIGIVEGIAKELSESKKGQNIFGHLAKAMKRGATFQKKKSKDWNKLVRKNSKCDPIGSSEKLQERRQSLRKHILDNLDKPKQLDDVKLLEYNEKLETVSRSTRLAYAKFMMKKINEESAKFESDIGLTKLDSDVVNNSSNEVKVENLVDVTIEPNNDKNKVVSNTSGSIIKKTVTLKEPIVENSLILAEKHKVETNNADKEIVLNAKALIETKHTPESTVSESKPIVQSVSAEKTIADPEKSLVVAPALKQAGALTETTEKSFECSVKPSSASEPEASDNTTRKRCNLAWI